ncbi:MAG: MBL fold metallo-hydrolase [Clostridiales bacterium]|nr:MBL fold metallo-hydrolase [Clostridiales bacterium]
MEITYLGHSCFKIVKDGFALILDPYKTDSVPGLSPLKETANQVIPSHKHDDHFGLGEVKLSEMRADTPFMISFIPTFHDEKEGALRGLNNVIVIDVDGLKIVHMGDIGCMLTDEELQFIKKCDILMIPVGGFFTIDAEQAREYVDIIEPKITIPMHYSGKTFGYDVISGVDKFTKLFDEKDVLVKGSVIEFDEAPQDRKVYVMRPLRAEKEG